MIALLKYFSKRNNVITAFKTVFVIFTILAHFSEFSAYLNPLRSNKNSLSHPYARMHPPLLVQVGGG